MHTKIELDYCGRPLCIDLGKVAGQADGAALVRFGETVVLATAVASKDVREDIDFFPLTVDYQEKTFAAGRIPGGFFKREGRPSEKEILTCRLIDRSVRPLFAGGLKAETQIIVTVLSADGENDTDVVSMFAASLAVEISDIPFQGPLAGVRVGRIDGEWVMNPLVSEIPRSDVNIFLSGTRDSIVMVEGGAAMVPEEGVLEALFQGPRGDPAAHRPAEEAQGPAWQDQARTRLPRKKTRRWRLGSGSWPRRRSRRRSPSPTRRNATPASARWAARS